jgi:hypothetical protein
MSRLNVMRLLPHGWKLTEDSLPVGIESLQRKHSFITALSVGSRGESGSCDYHPDIASHRVDLVIHRSLPVRMQCHCEHESPKWRANCYNGQIDHHTNHVRFLVFVLEEGSLLEKCFGIAWQLDSKGDLSPYLI